MTADNRQSGQVLIIALIFMGVLLVLMGGLLGFVSQNAKVARVSLAAEQALQLADGAVDKAVWQLNETAGSYTGETGTSFGAGTFDISVATISASLKEITVTAYVPNSITPRATKQVKVRATIDDTTISFNYGVQVGAGGVSMGNSAQITGSVYSNGPITGALFSRVTGTAYSAGATGSISNMLIDGSAYAHNMSLLVVGGTARGYALNGNIVGGSVYFYSISNCIVGGNASYTTKSSCIIGGSQTSPYPGYPDSPLLTYPIADQQITDWKDQAAAGGTIAGGYSIGQGASVSLGPKKITGDLNMAKDAILTLTGPLWVTGKIDIDKNATVALAGSYGGNTEVMIADGIIDLSKEVNFQRDDPGSYILALSLSSSMTSAISIAKSADALIAYAPNGAVSVSKSSVLREVTAYKLILGNDTEVIYESGLADVNFSSGSGASWAIERGTWREIN